MPVQALIQDLLQNGIDFSEISSEAYRKMSHSFSNYEKRSPIKREKFLQPQPRLSIVSEENNMSTSSKSETPARSSLLKGGQFSSPYTPFKTPMDSSGHYTSNPSLNNTAGSALAQILQGQMIDESVEVMDDDLIASQDFM